MFVSAHGNSLRALLIALREHTELRSLTDKEILDLEVPLSTPIGIIFDNDLRYQHKELWAGKVKEGDRWAASVSPAELRTQLIIATPDRASLAQKRGGIDLNRKALDLQINKDKAMLAPSPAGMAPFKNLDNIKIDALYPVILGVVSPVPNMPVMLGFDPKSLPGNPPSPGKLSKINDPYLRRELLSELAQRIGTQKTSISRMENHAEDIKLSTLEKVTLALGRRLKVSIA